MYLFSRLIKCHCGKNYRGKKYRDKNVYVCSGRSNYGESFCPTSEKIDEEDLLFLINGENNIDKISKILVDGENNIKIIMKNKEELLWSPQNVIRAT